MKCPICYTTCKPTMCYNLYDKHTCNNVSDHEHNGFSVEIYPRRECDREDFEFDMNKVSSIWFGNLPNSYDKGYQVNIWLDRVAIAQIDTDTILYKDIFHGKMVDFDEIFNFVKKYHVFRAFT